MCKIKTFIESLSENTTMTKKEYVLTAATCLLGGMVLGMLCSPKKHSVIDSNNGNSTDSNNNWSDDMWEDDMSEEALTFR